MFGLLALAFAANRTGPRPGRGGDLSGVERADDQGASYTASGLADVATYEGRFSGGGRVLAQGAAAISRPRMSTGRPTSSSPWPTRSCCEEGRPRRWPPPRSAGQQSVRQDPLPRRAGVLEAGATEKALALSRELASGLQKLPRRTPRSSTACWRLNSATRVQAIQDLTDANGLLDTWIVSTTWDGRIWRPARSPGRLLVRALPEAPRRGPVALPGRRASYGYFPPVYYYQGRVREALNSAKAAESYKAYLDIRGSLPKIRWSPKSAGAPPARSGWRAFGRTALAGGLTHFSVTLKGPNAPGAVDLTCLDTADIHPVGSGRAALCLPV